MKKKGFTLHHLQNNRRFKIRGTRNGAGFTLIETLVYVAVFAVLITVIILFVLSFIQSIAKNKIKKEVSLGVFSALKAMTYEIKMAKKIYTPTSVFSNNSGQLSLETNSGLPDDENITYVDFYKDSNNRLYIKREGHIPELLTSENLRVSNLEFEKIGSIKESVKINLTLEYNINNPDYKFSYSLSSVATIRK